MVEVVGLIISFATFLGIYALLGLSLNLEYGYAGLPNFGQVLFYAIGAFTAGGLTTTVLTLGSGLDRLGVPAAQLRAQVAVSRPLFNFAIFILGLLLAMLVSGAFGYLASYPTLRLREDYLAMTLLAFGEILRIIAQNYYPIAGGPFGVGGIPNPFSWLTEPDALGLAYTAVVLICVVAAYVYLEELVNSPFGRVLKSIRDDETTSLGLGKNVARTKGQVMIIGSAFAGLAGALYIYYTGFVGAGDFVSLVTMDIWVVVLLGGAASNLGIIFGAAAVTIIDRATRLINLELGFMNLPVDLNYLRWIIVGVVMIVILIFRPSGLVPERPIRTPAAELIDRKTPSSNG